MQGGQHRLVFQSMALRSTWPKLIKDLMIHDISDQINLLRLADRPHFSTRIKHIKTTISKRNSKVTANLYLSLNKNQYKISLDRPLLNQEKIYLRKTL